MQIVIDASLEGVFRSPKPLLVVPEDEEENNQPETNENTSKGTAIDSALLQSRIVRTNPNKVPVNDAYTIPTPDGIKNKWAGYPSNNPNKLSAPCLLKLKELYDIGKVNKKQKKFKVFFEVSTGMLRILLLYFRSLNV